MHAACNCAPAPSTKLNRAALPWGTCRARFACAAVARVIVPGLTGEAWVYFARLYALSQAMLRTAPDIPAH
jgi:hypothetical protein